MLWRVDPVEATSEYADRSPAGLERAAMRLGIDSPSEPRDDRDPPGRERAGEAAGLRSRAPRRGPGPDDRNGRPGQRTQFPANQEHGRRVGQSCEARGVVRVPERQNPSPDSHEGQNVLGRRGGARRREPGREWRRTAKNRSGFLPRLQSVTDPLGHEGEPALDGDPAERLLRRKACRSVPPAKIGVRRIRSSDDAPRRDLPGRRRVQRRRRRKPQRGRRHPFGARVHVDVPPRSQAPKRNEPASKDAGSFGSNVPRSARRS